MKNVTVKLLAADFNITVDRLIQQFADAGIHKTAVDAVTKQEKERLLAYMNQHSKSNTQLTVQRKKRSTLNIQGIGGKSKLVQIEVRKKRIYVHRDPLVPPATPIKLKLEITEKCPQNIEKYERPAKTENNYNYDQPIPSNELTVTDSKLAEVDKKLSIPSNELTVTDSKLAEVDKKLSIPSNELTVTDSKLAEVDKKPKKIKQNKKKSTADHKRTKKNRRILVTTWASIEDEEEIEEDRKVAAVERRTTSTSIRKRSKITKNKNNTRSIMSEVSSTLRQSFNKPTQAVNRDVIIGETISVAELANKMAVKSSQIITVLMKLGVMVTINQVINKETAQLVAEDMGHKVILLKENELEESLITDRTGTDTATVEKEPRAPIVTIMGHVDHGKTTLLDYIRATKVAANEAGGITQHIGAYHVSTDHGMITFIDTPGHAAFTAMRARGAKVTDLVVLVVAADDGTMPQTIEAIQHAKAAKVPIVVAVNKIDKKEADPNRVKNELTKYGVIPEEWGGESQFVNISAKLGTGIPDLLDAILLQAEVMELKAIHKGMANGVVIESFLDKGRGPVATVLVREGTLNCGDILLCGLEYGRVRAMRDELGRNIVSAGPSIPVEILGLSGVSAAGDEATVVRDEKKAREVALYRKGKFRDRKLASKQKNKLENMFEGEISELNIIFKSDVHGSAEAISQALDNLSTEEVKINIIGSGVGLITETDAILAAASNAILLGFNVRADAAARRIIDFEKLNVKYYSVIYDLITDMKQAMSSMLTPEYQQAIIGMAEVREVFSYPKGGAIAGCMVTEGVVQRNNTIRIVRDNIVIYQGELESIRRFKDDVNEVRNGMECGIGVKNYHDIRTGDRIEVLENIEIKRTI